MMETGMKTVYTLLAVFALVGLFLPTAVFADVISPKKQIEIKISVVKVSCKQGLVKVIKASDDSPACVKPSTAEKLEKHGWAKQVDPKKIEAVKMRLQAPPLGEVKKLSTVKQSGEAGRVETTPRTVGYNFIFDACAFDKTIRSPQVLVNSDSESKQVQLAHMILANTCQTSAVKIKASNPDSIKGTLTSKGKITDKITDLENTIADLKQKILDEKSNLNQLTEQESTPELRSKASESSRKIVDLRTQLNNAKGEYNTYLFVLHVDSKSLSQMRKQLDFEGAKIEGITFTTVNTYKRLISDDTQGVSDSKNEYNVLFQVCSDDITVRVPQVKITSDAETRIINLADKIPAGTCQSVIGKIKLSDPAKLTYELGTTQKVSTSISDIEKNIKSQQETLGILKEELSQLTRIAEKPFDFDEQVSDLTNEIVDLRNKINSNKAQLAQYHFQFYQ